MSTGALVLLDEEGARWWSTAGQAGEEALEARKPTEVFCGSLKAWAALEAAGADKNVRWLGGLGETPWSVGEAQLAEWQQALSALPPIPAQAPLQEPIRELLGGDLATPALMSLALLPIWADVLAAFSPVLLPVGAAFRPPRFSRLGDLPLYALAAVLAQRGQEVEVSPLLAGEGPSSTSMGKEGWIGPAQEGAVWLALGKLRHPEWPLVHLEASGLPVVLLEPEPAAALPDLFADAPRWRCHPHLEEGQHGATPLPACPSGGARASAGAWLDVLRQWTPLVKHAQALGEERQRLDRLLERSLVPSQPALVLVPEENDLVVERVLTLLRQGGLPYAVLHHTAEVLPWGQPLRWQRHLQPDDQRLVPLRSQREATGEVVSLDPVRAHLLDALELEAPLPWPEEPAVGWVHYPLMQQALLPLADPLAYWMAVDTVQDGLKELGVPLRMARKPPLEPKGLGDAVAQGLRGALPCQPLATVLAESQVVIAPGHLGTAHLEAMARGRAVALVSPARLRRPSLLLTDRSLPMPRLTGEGFLPWWRAQSPSTLRQLAQEQREWVRQQVMTTTSLGGWLRDRGVSLESRPQRFLGSGLMVQRPLLERAEQVSRWARRLQALRSSPPGRLLRSLRAVGRRA